ncbi:MAG: uracil-DNA glycosylase [Lactobacillales bacterium]|jgi:uracil-DNA glycosylase|nr:uracil-DNA glycosylase [Lactobacillales bacterium]
MIKPFLHNEWDEVLKEEVNKDYFTNLCSFLTKEYQEQTIYPIKHNVFRALQLTDFSKVKVVILGQDPYHGAGQAHGLSFSVQDGVKLPRSLVNIFTEMQNDLQIPIATNGNLTSWAEQGVLMLNTVLTVRAGQANSHAGHGWEEFTDAIIQKLSEREKGIVFVLWGRQAQRKIPMIASQHVIIASPHPSPFSAHSGFFGSKPFSRTNQALEQFGEAPIHWALKD